MIGDFVIGRNREGDLSLTEGAARFFVIEAKMFSRLSSGVKNVSYFNQAARNVACIAEVICRAQIFPSSLKEIGFFVLAPESQINAGSFAEHMAPEIIRNIVRRRVSEYQESEKDKWFEDWFLPTLEKIQLREISWEEICRLINQHDSAFGEQLDTFYGKCLEFNQYVAKRFAF